MAKSETLQEKWQGRITAALKVREEWATEFRIALGRAYFEGNQNPGFPPQQTRAQASQNLGLNTVTGSGEPPIFLAVQHGGEESYVARGRKTRAPRQSR